MNAIMSKPGKSIEVYDTHCNFKLNYNHIF